MPQTLAQTVRAKHPGAYEDMSDQQLEAAVSAKYPGVYDDLPRTTAEPARTPDRPHGLATIGEVSNSKQAIFDKLDKFAADGAARRARAGAAAVSALPVIGGMVGGVLGNVPGAALGGAAGEAYKQLINRARGEEAPTGPLDAAQDIAVEGGIQGAVQGAGRAVMAGVKMIPTRAKAGAQFQQVMNKVGTETVDMAGPRVPAERILELSKRGASKPKVITDLFKRMTDTTLPEPTYTEMRDFYSNISRLSAKDMLKTNPIVKMEIGKLRVALDRALAQTAAKGGEEATYRAAMKQYRIAARINEVATKAAKYAAGGAATAAGAGAAYQILK